MQMPMDQLQKLPFLNTFSVVSCPKLIAPRADIGLPPSIRNLLINSCGVYESYLLNAIFTLTSLTTLRLHNCVITALPSAEAFKNLTIVRHLEIVCCSKLAALDGIEELTSLTELCIIGCRKLDELVGISSKQMFQATDLSHVGAISPSHFGKLEKLRISPLILQWEPLRRVNSVTHLTVENCRCLPEDWLMQNRNHLKHFGMHDATQLEFLPSTMACLTSLKTLELHGAVLIQSLPELPASLEVLQILECHPMLQRRCKKRRGRDWHKIAHIPRLQIVQDRPSSYSYNFYRGF
uniref:Uncharacterized protein n=1 Tax=Arundo donax TaxID=35708 RepID=A0A0A9HIC0_ARUDO